MKSSSRVRCHVDIGPFCMRGEQLRNMKQDYLKAYIAYMELYYPDITFKNNECVMDMYYKDYSLAKSLINSSTTEDDEGIYRFVIIVGIAALITVIAFVLLLRKPKNNMDEEEPEETFVE